MLPTQIEVDSLTCDLLPPSLSSLSFLYYFCLIIPTILFLAFASFFSFPLLLPPPLSFILVIHDQTNGSFAQAAYTDWGGFLDLWPAGLVKYEKLYDTGYPNATLMAQNVINNLVGKARFIYVHLDDIDHAGHTQGFGTDEYYRTVQDVDAASK